MGAGKRDVRMIVYLLLGVIVVSASGGTAIGYHYGHKKGWAARAEYQQALDIKVNAEMLNIGICAWWTAAEYDKLCDGKHRTEKP